MPCAFVGNMDASVPCPSSCRTACAPAEGSIVKCNCHVRVSGAGWGRSKLHALYSVCWVKWSQQVRRDYIFS